MPWNSHEVNFYGKTTFLNITKPIFENECVCRAFFQIVEVQLLFVILCPGRSLTETVLHGLKKPRFRC